MDIRTIYCIFTLTLLGLIILRFKKIRAACRKAVFRILLAAIIPFVLLIVFLTYIKLPFYIDGQKNKRIMLQYIEQAHGKDYKIAKESIGKEAGIGGFRQTDFLDVSQFGFTYRVEAENGQITGDTYTNSYAGKIVSDYLIEKCIERNYDDYTINCSVHHLYANILMLPKLPNDIDGIKDKNLELDIRIVLYLNANGIDMQTLINSAWIYDFYKTIATEFKNFYLLINIKASKEESEKSFHPRDSATGHYNFSANQLSKSNNGAVFSKKEFFDRFIFTY